MKNIIRLTILCFGLFSMLHGQTKTAKGNCSDINTLVNLIENNSQSLLGEKKVEKSSFFGASTVSITYTTEVNFEDYEGIGYKDRLGTYVEFTIVENVFSEEKVNTMASEIRSLLKSCLNKDWIHIIPEDIGKEKKELFVKEVDKDKGVNYEDYEAPYISYSIYKYGDFSLSISFIDPRAKE